MRSRRIGRVNGLRSRHERLCKSASQRAFHAALRGRAHGSGASVSSGATVSIDPGRGLRLMRFVLGAAGLAAVAFSIHFLLSVAGKYHPPNLATTTVAWICTAVAGLLDIGRGNERAHRRWMMRNDLVTLASVLFRALLGLARGSGVAVSPGAIAGLLCASWMLPLLVHETLGALYRLIRARAGRRTRCLIVSPNARQGLE